MPLSSLLCFFTKVWLIYIHKKKASVAFWREFLEPLTIKLFNKSVGVFLLSIISEGIDVPRQVLNTHRCVWSVTTVAQLKSYILHLQLQQDERRMNWRYAARRNIKSFDLPIRHDRIICATVNEEQRIRTYTDYCVWSFIGLVLMFTLGLFGSVCLCMTDS